MLEAGARAVLLKSVEPEQLKEAMLRVLEDGFGPEGQCDRF
ncbi:MAG TPA: hypothetical protein VGQ51_14150 [Puia sp.]|jgi:DNA-binding NarL/FixJ family response regulator|nr:hypothetical protein [Puia sp.]